MFVLGGMVTFNMKTNIIIAYCFLSLFYGIEHIGTILIDDINNKQMKYGRVSLICSYWYERYEPRKLIESGGQRKDLFPLLKDRASGPIYLKEYYLKKQ